MTSQISTRRHKRDCRPFQSQEESIPTSFQTNVGKAVVQIDIFVLPVSAYLSVSAAFVVSLYASAFPAAEGSSIAVAAADGRSLAVSAFPADVAA